MEQIWRLVRKHYIRNGRKDGMLLPRKMVPSPNTKVKETMSRKKARRTKL